MTIYFEREKQIKAYFDKKLAESGDSVVVNNNTPIRLKVNVTSTTSQLELQKKSKEIDKAAKASLSKEEYSQYESLKFIANSKSYNTVREEVIKWNSKHPDFPIISQYNIEGINNESLIKYFSESQSGVKNKGRDDKYSFKLGKRENWIREINTQSVTSANNRTNKYSHATGSINYGGVGNFSQAKRGDCYLISEIQAIKNTKDGQKILSKIAQQNEDGSVTVTLPGATAIKNDYINRGYGEKCQITGTYTITKEALAKAKKLSGKDYANGNVKVIALELAMETYRAEMRATMKNIGNLTSDNYQVGSAQSSTQPITNGDNLSGGYTWDAGFILTGQKSDVYYADRKHYNNSKLFDDKKYRRISEDEMNLELSTKSKAYSGYSEITSISTKQSKMQQMLSKYAGHEDEYALTFSVRVASDGPDGKTKKASGHALAIKKITNENVYVQNPWHPDQIQVIPRKEFEQMVTGIVAQKMDLASVEATYRKNENESRRNGTTPKIPKPAKNQIPLWALAAHASASIVSNNLPTKPNNPNKPTKPTKLPQLANSLHKPPKTNDTSGNKPPIIIYSSIKK